MGLSDPFSTTYAGSFKAGSSIGEGIDSAAGDVAKEIALQKNRKMATDMLQKFGMIQTKDPTLEQLTQGAKDFAKSQGYGDLQINEGDDPNQAKQNIMGIYKALNIPIPKGTPVLNLTPGTKYDPTKGEVSFEGLKKEKSLPEQIAEYSAAQNMLNTAGLGGEVTPKTTGKGVSLAPSTGTTRQDKLEKQAGDYMNRIVNSRSGGLGLQDSKVNQAIDLRTLIDQSKDPQTGEYKISPAFQTELVLGLARLVSPSGNVGVELEKELSQKTAQEGLANMLIYFGGDPKKIGGTTQSVIQAYVDAIDRQGLTAEQLRDKYTEGIKQRAEFSGLNDESKKRVLNSSLGSSFKEYLNNGKTNATPAGSPQSNGQDMSQMTDEQLKAIINGK